ncbi:hypothetical protein [Chitinophaga sp. 22536]|uniref:hypothetical protein n=1 Tax=Chitinophaga sp. 22536 TaxID=3453939 RepID=UPI003F829975
MNRYGKTGTKYWANIKEGGPVATFVVFHSWLKAILQGVITSLNLFKDKMSGDIKVVRIKNEQNEQIL